MSQAAVPWCLESVRQNVVNELMIGDRWGVSESEVARSYPCDEFFTAPVLQAWRAVNVEAPVEAVWPWVAQVRLAPYSYDCIDNAGRRSPRELVGCPSPGSEKPSPLPAAARWARSSRWSCTDS